MSIFIPHLPITLSESPPFLLTFLFATARIAGWAKHLMEQRSHNVLIRPESLYDGPPISRWISIAER
ncbi:MAG: citrate/2-methylcitrate synthase [Parachlamydiaceae bacterium]